MQREPLIGSSMEHSLPATDGDDEIQTIPVRHQVGESQTLTMVVKIALENTEDLRWVAVMLDANPGARAREAATAPDSAATAATAAPTDALHDRPAPPHTPAE